MVKNTSHFFLNIIKSYPNGVIKIWLDIERQNNENGKKNNKKNNYKDKNVRSIKKFKKQKQYLASNIKILIMGSIPNKKN